MKITSMKPTAKNRAVLLRLCIVIAVVPSLGVLTYVHWNWLAVTIGILSGTAFLLLGIAAGGGIGNARGFGQGPADVSTRIGVCLAAAGIGSFALGHDPPFPLPFRVFYGIIMGLVSVIALILAVKGMRDAK